MTYNFKSNLTFVRKHPEFSFGLNLGFILTRHDNFDVFLHGRGLTVMLLLTEAYNDYMLMLDSMGITDNWEIRRFSK